MTNFFVSLLVQGVGGLLLVLVCYTLYASRRRAYFLYWTLAWLGFSLWLLAGGLKMHWQVLVQGPSDWLLLLQDLAVIAGWSHAAFWGLGTLLFWRGHRDTSASRPGTIPSSAAAGTSPISWRQVVLGLVIMVVLATCISRTLSWSMRNALLSGALALVYSWSAFLFTLLHRRREHTRALGVLLLALLLAVSALERVQYAVCYLLIDGDLVPDYLTSITYADFLLQTLIAVGTIIVLLDDEQLALGDALRRLEESEARFRLLFEHSGVGMALLTPEGQFLQVNGALERFLGYEAAKLRGRYISELVHPSEAGNEPGSKYPLHAVEPVLYERERRYLHKDGRTLWARVLRVPVPDADGTIRYHVGVLLDITPRRQAEETLREERDFSTQVLETADALIMAVDHQGRIVRFNGKCAAVTGYKEEEVRGRVFWEFLLPQPYIDQVRLAFGDIEQDTVHLKQLGVKPELAIVSSELPWRTRTGEERLIAWRYTTVRDARRTLRYVIATGVDLTEQRRLEEQLRHAQKMETLGTLVGGIAHDFNNQLTAVLGNLDLALAEIQDNASGPPVAEHSSVLPPRDVATLLTDAERAAQRCADMTQRLLTFSRRQITQVRPAQPSTLISEVVRLLQRLLPATIAIETRFDPHTWQTRVDSTQFHQVLMNLAINARDAMPNGGTLTLATANRVVDAEQCKRDLEARPGHFIEVSVQDSGNGMTPEVMARIFEPFFTTKQFGQGTGLGLAMVFGIVKAHRGWIRVSSTPGQGTSFRLYFPAEGEAETLLKQSESNGTPKGGSVVATEVECVLVVDDEDLVRHLAKAVLAQAHFRVLEAADGPAALRSFREAEGKVDLVLLDYTMPGMTGLQVLEELRALDPDVSVIFASGYAMDIDSEQLLAAGARAFLPKPYRPAELLRAVREALEHAAVS